MGLSARISEVRFVGLPEGHYEVNASLNGLRSRRAVATSTIHVSGGLGR
jgi:hypothetical protein